MQLASAVFALFSGLVAKSAALKRREQGSQWKSVLRMQTGRAEQRQGQAPTNGNNNNNNSSSGISPSSPSLVPLF